MLTAADRALPDLDFDLDSWTGSPQGLTNPNARGLRRSPVTVRRHARGGKWQAGARALGGCGSRPRGQACDGAGRLRTGRHAVRGSRQGTAVRRRQAPSSIAPSRGATRYSCHIARCSARILLNRHLLVTIAQGLPTTLAIMELFSSPISLVLRF